MKERHFVRWTGSYVAAGWILLEAVDLLVERGVIPEIAFHVALVWFLGGLLATVVVAWNHGERGRQRISGTEVGLLSGFGVAAVLLSASVVSSDDPAGGLAAAGAAGLEERRVAVTYFENLGGPEDDYLADALTEELIASLGAVGSLDVPSRNAVSPFRVADVPLDSVARALGAATVVEGTVDRVGDRIRIDVRLVDGVSGARLQSAHLERPADEVLELGEEVADEAVTLLRGWLGEHVSLQRRRAGTENDAAWVLARRAERERKEGEAALESEDVPALVAHFERADSLLEAASGLDPNWAQPVVDRAYLAFRWAVLSAGEPLEAAEWIEVGLARATRALELDSRNAGALEVRGRLKNLKWLLGLEVDHATAQALIRDAEEDLERAVALDETRADAWAVLASIHAQKPDNVEAKLAALRAYEADAYLASAESVLWRLYTTSYDLEQFPDAAKYCAEGRRRFPGHPRFAECRLWLMAAPRALEPDTAEARLLAEEVVQGAPAPARDREAAKAGILRAAVAARAAQEAADPLVLDRARERLRSVRPSPAVDPTRELLGVEAIFRLQMGDSEVAIDLLKEYLTASPEHRSGWRWSSHWWWRDVQSNPEFRALVGSGTLDGSGAP